MKLSCLQENLNYGLGIVSGAVATRITLPITNNILVETDHARLRLTATNLEMAIRCWVDGSVEEDGAIALPAKLLTEFVGSLKNDKVDIAMAPKTHTVAIHCARDKATIAGLDAKDFPPIATIDQGFSTTIEVEALKQAIAQVIFAVASGESRPVLGGVNALLEGSTMTLAAADGFRLAVYKLDLAKAVWQKVSVIIPAQALSKLTGLMKNQTDPVQVTINPNRSQILFRLKNIELVSTLIDGTFPQYEALIPQNTTTKAVVDIGNLLQAVKTAVIFARENSSIVRVVVTPGGTLTPGKMMVSAKSEDMGDNQGEIDAVVQGPENKIAFKGQYLTEGLSALKEEKVSFEMTGPSSPILVKPVGNENYSYTVMPMFVAW